MKEKKEKKRNLYPNEVEITSESLMVSFKSCQIYHLDTELPGACEGCYWPIHLASFSLAIQTTNNVILIALLCAAVLRLITATLVPSIIATGGPGGEILSSALQLSDRIYLLVFFFFFFENPLPMVAYFILLLNILF